MSEIRGDSSKFTIQNRSNNYLAAGKERLRRRRERMAKRERPPLIPAPIVKPLTEAVKILHSLS